MQDRSPTALEQHAPRRARRNGSFAGVLRRPDPSALGADPDTGARDAAHLSFARESDRGGRWEASRAAPRKVRSAEPAWTLDHGGATFHVRPTPFKHVGLFPEQVTNWELVRALVGAFGVERPRLLNLFGYTGAASVVAAQAGYEVTHVDASKTAITWAVDNAEASRLGRSAMRVVCEDAVHSLAGRRAGGSVPGVLPTRRTTGAAPRARSGARGEPRRARRDGGELAAERALVILSTYAVGASPLTRAAPLARGRRARGRRRRGP